MKLVLSFLLPFIFVTSGFSAAYHQDRIYTRAIITNIETIPIKSEKNVKLIERRVHLKIIDGDLKDQKKIAIFRGEDDAPKYVQYKPGNTVFIGVSKVGYTEDMEEYVSLYDIDNTKSIIFLGIFLLLIIVLVGKTKGFLSLIALLITILLLFFVFIPLTLKGYPPLLLAVIISIVSILITLPIISGFNLKTFSAISGASLGIIICSILALLFGWIMHLSGIITDSMLTVFYASNVTIDLRDLSLSSMIIAALGAIMDVAISIASSTAELYRINPDLSVTQAMKSVLNIGTDILGSMVNTLILAYVGSSLSLLILISLRFEPGMPYWMIFNYNPVLSELVKSAIGSIGMFLSIPITAFIATNLYKKHYHKLKSKKN